MVTTIGYIYFHLNLIVKTYTKRLSRARDTSILYISFSTFMIMFPFLSYVFFVFLKNYLYIGLIGFMLFLFIAYKIISKIIKSHNFIKKVHDKYDKESLFQRILGIAFSIFFVIAVPILGILSLSFI